MSVNLSERLELFEDVGEYRPVQDGDNPEFIYVRARFDNGYECFIKNTFGDDAITAEIQAILDNFNSPEPPVNWQPYNGYGT